MCSSDLARHLAVALLAAFATQAAAQTWPARPIRIVVPFPPGGSTDLIARRIADKFQPSLGQPVVVENKPGAGGAVGSEAVAKAAADGYTLGMGVTGSHAVSLSLNPSLPYHPLKDFEPISLVVSAPLTILVNPSVPAKTVKELVALGQPLSHGTPGPGTSMHLTAEMFNLAAGTKFVHVPYKGTAGALNDLIGGQIQMMFGDFLITLPHVKAGKLRALAVTSGKRSGVAPELPTVAEAGVPGYVVTGWYGMFVPAATPPAIINTLNSHAVRALRSKDVSDRLTNEAAEIVAGTPAQFAEFQKAEIAKWAAVVRKAAIKPENF